MPSTAVFTAARSCGGLTLFVCVVACPSGTLGRQLASAFFTFFEINVTHLNFPLLIYEFERYLAKKRHKINVNAQASFIFNSGDMEYGLTLLSMICYQLVSYLYYSLRR